MIIALILAAFLLLCVTLAALHSLPWLESTNAVLISMLAMFGGVRLTFEGWDTTVGTIPFSVVMFGVALKHVVYGRVEAQKAVKNLLFALVVAMGTLIALNAGDMLPAAFAAPRIRIVGAMFCSFAVAQTAFLWFLDHPHKWRPVVYIPAGMAVIQALDSFLFYPTAFGQTFEWREVASYSVLGALVRAVVAVMAIPPLAIVLAIKRRSDISR